LIWRKPGGDKPKGLGVFGRILGAPADRNLVNFYVEGDVTLIGMIPHRSADALAIGFSHTGISDRVHAFDIESGLTVARAYEALLEIATPMKSRPGGCFSPTSNISGIWG